MTQLPRNQMGIFHIQKAGDYGTHPLPSAVMKVRMARGLEGETITTNLIAEYTEYVSRGKQCVSMFAGVEDWLYGSSDGSVRQRFWNLMKASFSQSSSQ